MTSANSLGAELRARGIWQNASHGELEQRLERGPLTFYAGFDPSGPSLQVGNLFVLITMRRLQLAKHRPLVLLGGATGMVGDPSGKSRERPLLDGQTLEANAQGVRAHLQKFLDFGNGPEAAKLLDNRDWMAQQSFLGVLREVGKHLRMSDMLARDAVKSRLESAEGLSYTEFSYQVLQAFDFAHLCSKYDCELQIGATDQWGNITAGIDLAHKLHGRQAYGLVIPLVTDAQGRKLGKSEGQALYLNAEQTSPYQLYQFFFNVEDALVGRYLRYYSFLSLEEIQSLEEEARDRPHLRNAHRKLAQEVVGLVHGAEGVRAAERAAEFFFGKKIEGADDAELESIFATVPSASMPRRFLQGEGGDVLEMLAQTPLFKSKGEARRSIQQKGVSLNNCLIEDIHLKITSAHLASQSALVIRKGKKNYCLVRFR